MPVLVWILRIIGIMLLVMIGLVLLAVLLLLFSPIRYDISADKKAGEDLHVKARLTWAFPIFSVVWEYKEELVTTVRLCGLRMKKRNKQPNDRESEGEEIGSKSQKKKKSPVKEQTKEKGKSEKKVHLRQNVIEEKNFDDKTEKSQIQEYLEESEGKPEQSVEQESFEKAERKPIQGQEKNSIRDIIKDIPVRVQRLKEKYLQTIWELKEKKAHVLQPITKYMDFWNAIENQAGIMLLKTHGRELLVHILPKRWKGYIHFGMENPASTGKALAVLSVLYGLAGKFPRIVPDFEQEVLEGRIQTKGRLYGCVLLVHFVKVWRNKEFHRVKSNFEKLRRK